MKRASMYPGLRTLLAICRRSAKRTDHGLPGFPGLRMLPAALLSGCGWLAAQSPDTAVSRAPSFEPPAFLQERLEELTDESQAAELTDFNTLHETLQAWLERPLDLNHASVQQLEELGLLSDFQLNQFLAYRQALGPLISIYELQAIPGFEPAFIHLLLPFVTLKAELDDYQVSLRQLLSGGSNELYLRWSYPLERALGYTQPPDAGNRYLGDANQLYLRFKHAYSNRFSWGFTAEKDRGEPFFRGENRRRGFDFWSGHLGFRDMNRWLRSLIIGDFSANLGQGLILYTGFGYGKSAAISSIRRGGRALSPYASVNEAAFLRGLAITTAWRKKLESTIFISCRQRDASVSVPDSLAFPDELPSFSAFDLDGFHRTPAEMAGRETLRQWLAGGSLRYAFDRGHLAVNSVFHQFDARLVSRPQLYNAYFFKGNSLANASLDFSFRHRNLSSFGELAVSDNGTLAGLAGLFFSPDRKVDVSLLFRHYPFRFNSLMANPVAETTGGRNESGLYLGIEIRPHRHWLLNGYFDIWQHAFFRFMVDAPSQGYEYRTRLSYQRRRQYEAYIELQHEIKEGNIPIIDSPLNDVIPNHRFQLRLHFSLKISPALEWRSRMDYGYADNEINQRQRGNSISQDLLFRPVGSPLSFTLRYALFDTDGYQVRFYNYENGLLYNFAIPAYYNQGSRFYINLRYRGIKQLMIEMRVARTFWANQPFIGSGTEQLPMPVRTDFSAQLKYVF